jgi:hypothetical protein
MSINNLEFLDLIINEKHPDNVKIRYYPSNINNESSNITIVKDLCDEDMMKLKMFLKSSIYTSETFTEYGIKDTFVRVSDKDSKHIPRNSRIFFRRELQMFKIANFIGVFVIEMYHMCKEEDLPHIVKYQYDTVYCTTTYTLEKNHDALHVCFTKINNHGLGSDQSFIDINRDLDVLTNFSKTVIVFLDDILALRNELKIRI